MCSLRLLPFFSEPLRVLVGYDVVFDVRGSLVVRYYIYDDGDSRQVFYIPNSFRDPHRRMGRVRGISYRGKVRL